MPARGFNPAKGPGSSRTTSTAFKRRGSVGSDPGIVVSTFHGGSHIYSSGAHSRSQAGVKGGGHFSNMAPGDAEFFTFDFVELLAPGEVINSATWTNTVRRGTDETPAARRLGLPVIAGSKVRQLIGQVVDGCTYRLTCVAVTDSGQRFELFADCSVKTLTAGAFSPALTPNEVEWFGFDFTDILAPAEAVINGLWDVAIKVGTQANPNVMKFGGVVIRGNQVWQLVNATTGVVGATYVFACSAITDQGQTITQRRTVKIK